MARHFKDHKLIMKSL